MPTQRFKRDNSSPMRKAHQTRSGYDATNQSCPRSPEGAIHAFARLRLLQGVTNMALIFGRNTTTKQKTRNVVVRKNKRQYTSIWDRWQRDETYRESQLVHEWSDASVRYLDHTAKIDLSQKRRTRRGRDTTIYFTCGVSTKISKRHLYHKDQDTKMQRKHCLIYTSKVRQDCGAPFYPKSSKATLAKPIRSFNAKVSWVA